MHGDPPNTCYGRDCFSSTLLVTGLLGMLASFSSLMLYLRTRNLYALMFADIKQFTAEVEAQQHDDADHSRLANA